MTPRIESDDEDPPLDDRAIDRLVDGALEGRERLALLARLEHEPDGWRRCALAFLEAQAWTEALRPIADGESACPLPPREDGLAWGEASTGAPLAQKALKVGPRRTGGRLYRRIPLAAALLAAFAAGWVVRGRTPQEPAVPALAAPARQEIAAAHPAPPAPPSAPGTARPVSETDPLLRRLQREGYQVERRQRYVSMETGDGRRLALPIDEVRVQFIGDRTY